MYRYIAIGLADSKFPLNKQPVSVLDYFCCDIIIILWENEGVGERELCDSRRRWPSLSQPRIRYLFRYVAIAIHFILNVPLTNRHSIWPTLWYRRYDWMWYKIWNRRGIEACFSNRPHFYCRYSYYFGHRYFSQRMVIFLVLLGVMRLAKNFILLSVCTVHKRE